MNKKRDLKVCVVQIW